MGNKFVKIVLSGDVAKLVKLGVGLACVNLMAEGLTALVEETAKVVANAVKSHMADADQASQEAVAEQAV